MSNHKLGILVGGGPAPGINGVISAATIEAINLGWEVIGIMDGFKHLARGTDIQTMPLTIDEVSRIHFRGGSILRTSRENPTKDPGKMQNVINSLSILGINRLITIGGEDTIFSSSMVEKEMQGKIHVAHVPKTIDNDLPLPNNLSTFGYQTARHFGVEIVMNLMEDAFTTNRWYFVIAMGRKAGHLALGIGKAAGATLTIIGEEFTSKNISIGQISDILEGAIIKRRAMGKDQGVAILAEGLVERFDPKELEGLEDAERDEYGHIRLSEVDLGKIIKDEVKKRLEKRGIKITIVDKNIGYELRCASPIPFDAEYTRNLGHGAIKFLTEGKTGAVISMPGGVLIPIYFKDLMDPKTGRTAVRYVDIKTEAYEVARAYMIRLNKQDFSNPEQLKLLAKTAKTTPEEFKKQFESAI
ncbi:MAG: 6-phosphofructokinase [Planctomycetes bacterium]|nr:6-phosphofructokinase [Planctomycetota bacterium]